MYDDNRERERKKTSNQHSEYKTGRTAVCEKKKYAPLAYVRIVERERERGCQQAGSVRMA